MAEAAQDTEGAPVEGGQQQAASLLDAGTPPAEGQQAAEGGEVQEWFWSDGVKGEGEPPEWFKGDKYKTIEEQAKAYPELAKKLGSFTGAPEAYELTLPDGVEGAFDPEHPILQRFMERAKDAGMSQDMFTATLHDFIEYELGVSEANIAEQKQALGPKADARIAAVRDTLAARLPEEQFQALVGMAKDAATFEAIEALVQSNAPAPVPREGTTDMSTLHEQLKDLRTATDDKGQRLYDTDPATRAKAKELYRKIYGDAPAQEAVGRG
jgi:hypothetical protein